MARFVSGSGLSDAIMKVLAGNNVRCAVAFWGAGAEALLTHVPGDNTCIICDVHMGSTSPAALRALGAPENDLLRHIPYLHAKVYISDEGAVVGSANASDNGVGIDGPARLIESGVFLAPGDSAFNEAVSWFKAQLKASKQVDKSALELAAKRFQSRPTFGRRAVRPDSLLDLIAADPDRFSKISIVLVEKPTTHSEQDEVRASVRSAHPEIADIKNLPGEGMFIGWDTQDIACWQRKFIEFWMPNNRLSVYGRTGDVFNIPPGTVISHRDWPSVRSAVGGELPTAAQISKTDGQMVRQLLDMYGNKLFSARELAAEIERLSVHTPA